MDEPKRPWPGHGWFSYARLARALGLVLLAAAILKGHEAVVAPAPRDDFLGDQWFVAGLVSFEGALGWWLVFGVFPRASRAIALACFTCFFGVAFTEAVAGKRSCGCFGAAEVSPWAMTAFDAAAVVALALTRPAAPPGLTWRTWLALTSSLLPSAVAVGLIAAREPPTLDVVPEKISWGLLGGSERRQVLVILKNNSGRAVELSPAETTCDCLSAQLARPSIPPGGESLLCVQLDLGRERGAVGARRVLVRGRMRDGGVAFVLPVEFFVSDAGESKEVVTAGIP